MEQGGAAADQHQAGHAERQRQRRTPQGRGDQCRGNAVEAGLEEGLARGGQAALGREGIEREEAQAGHGQRHAQRVDENGQDAPRQPRRQRNIEQQVDAGGAAHYGIAGGDGARQRHLAGQAAGKPRTAGQSGHGRAEQPEKAGFRHPEVGHQEDRGGQDIDEEAAEVEGQRRAGGQEGRRGHDFPVGAGQVSRAQGLAFFRRQRFRQQFPTGQPQDAGGEYQEGEDRTPAEQGLQPAADDRGDGGGQREHHGDLRHQALGLGAVEQVADDGPADDDARPGGDALHGPPEPQLLDAGGQHAAGRGDGEQADGDQDDLAPPEAVGNGAVPQGHQGEGEQVGRQGLLHFQRRRLQLFADLVEGGQVGVDGKGAERRERGQQGGDAPGAVPVALSHGQSAGTGWLRRRAARGYRRCRRGRQWFGQP